MGASEHGPTAAYCQHDGEPWSDNHWACMMLWGTGIIVEVERTEGGEH